MKTAMPSELILDRYCLDEANEDEKAVVQAWLQSDPDAHQYILNRKNQAEQAGIPVPTFTDLEKRVLSRHSKNKLHTHGRSVFVIPLTSAVGILLVVTLLWQRNMSKNNDWNTKGSNQIICTVKHGSSFTKITDTALCFEGDTLQIYNQSLTDTYIAVFYSEKKGPFISAYQSDSAFLIKSSPKPTPLPFSLVVDSTTGVIEIDVVSSTKPFLTEDGLKFLKNNNNRFYKNHYLLIRKQL